MKGESVGRRRVVWVGEGWRLDFDCTFARILTCEDLDMRLAHVFKRTPTPRFLIILGLNVAFACGTRVTSMISVPISTSLACCCVIHFWHAVSIQGASAGEGAGGVGKGRGEC